MDIGALNVFPARLEGLAGGKLDKVRVEIRDGRLRAWRSFGRKVELVGTAQVTDVQRTGTNRRAPWKITTDDGTELTLTAAGSCGCGDPLKRFDPTKWVDE